MKVAYVSGFYGRCGIISYGRAQVRELSKLCELKVFAEKSDDAPPDPNVIYCWDRFEFPKFELIEELHCFKPDVILINHEYSYWSKSYFYTSLVSYLRWKGYKVYTILHSVYPYHLDKVVTESAARDIIVHTIQQKECLISKGLDGSKINIVPHGISFHNEKEELLEKLWNCWDCPTILSYGFLYHYKGGLRALDIVNKVKETIPNIHFILLASESPKNMGEHDKVYKELMGKAEKLDLLNNITVHRGFVSEEILKSHLRTATVALFPYSENGEHSVISASGAVRIAIQTTIPIVTSEAHLFDDLSEVVLKGKEDKDMIAHILNILEGRIDAETQNKNRIEFIKKTSWANIAAQLMEIFEGK